ncbi:hypothetical protein PI739_14520 [Pseudomonas cerasi]|uniref:hypothetical protein n=1 Tax=Pseudomonas cerasi TaxID=1583341 RepID=UPI0023010F7D|nr:hypothetical protein [Pseudomonas cerasi]MDA7013576.1 hypothetical protein [Pseudomonas cerasi]
MAKKKKRRKISEPPRERIKKIKKQLLEARALMDELLPGKGSGLPVHIFRLEDQLRILEGHLLSKFDERMTKVEGSFGSGKRR